MKVLLITFAAFFFLVPPRALADSWSAYLVDSKCFDASERNVNPLYSSAASRDKQQEIRQCTASFKTKSFAVVGRDGFTRYKLNGFGNELAGAFVRKFGKKSFREVTVTGEKHFDTIFVTSIADPK